MPRKSSIQYNPKLSVKENAILNNVSESGIYYYIRSQSINRNGDRVNNVVEKITNAINSNPNASPYKIAKITGFHIATVKKYWNSAESGQEVMLEAKNRSYRKPSIKELETYYTTDKSVANDLLRVEQFGKRILDPFCCVGNVAEVLKSNGYKVDAYDIQDREYGKVADFHRTDWELGKYDIVSIPPTDYNLILAIKRCIDVAKNKVALLLPMDVTAGKERYEQLFKDYPPNRIHAYIDSICFFRNANEPITNTKGHAWFIWEKKRKSETILDWIYNIPLKETAMKKVKDSIQTDETVKGIIGAVIGDIVGSSHEFTAKIKNKDKFKLFGASNSITDDTVMTIAVADALLKKKTFTQSMRDWGNKYPYSGYAKRFRKWLKNEPVFNDSAGNGSAMRVSPVGFKAKSIEEALKLAKKTAIPSHNSKDGIKAAQCTAAAIYMACNGYKKTEIIEYIKKQFKYQIFETEEDVMRFVEAPENAKTVLAHVTMPVALSAFMQGDSFESVLRLAVYFGVDTDTTGAICASLAGALYGIPREIAEQAANYIPKDMLEVINEFDGNNLPNNRITPSNIRHNGVDTVVVYGANIDDSEGEKGRFETRLSKSNYHPLKGFAIRTIGTSVETMMQDVKQLISTVEEHPEKMYYIFDVGLSEKSNRGIELMAQLLKPLKDKENVYFHKDFWDYYNRY